jgi:hypothetical protein
VLWLLLLGCDASPAPQVFIALGRDFAPFRSWTRFSLGDAPLEGHPDGPRFGYVKEPPRGGAYPIGSIIVKSVEVTPDEQSWSLFAMVKRGGGYNADGARGWEYFTLALTSDGAPIVLQRGASPIGYEGGVGCNRCHAVAGAEKTDYILSPALQP